MGGPAVGSARGGVGARRSDLVGSTVGVSVSDTASNVLAGEELLKGGGLTVGLGVETRRVGGITIASLKDVVGVVTGHDKLAAHDIELVLALESGRSLLATGDADTEADLVVGDVVHPLLVEDILTGDVGGDVTTDRVTHVGSTVRIKLTTLIARSNADLGKVTKSHKLDVEGGLDKVGTSDSSVGLECGRIG